MKQREQASYNATKEKKKDR